MIRVAVLGAGRHSQREHLPALALYQHRHPGQIELAVLCDRQVNVAAQYGFRHYCDSLDTMLNHRPDAVIAITPVDVTAEVACRILASGIPLLMEKPIGRTVAEVEQVCAAAAGRTAMVSMNRRFDPFMVAAREWLGARTVQYVRATMVRHGRPADGFVEDAGLHAVDTVRFLAGDIAECLGHSLRFASGASGTLELLPDGGHWVETYDVLGPGFHVQAQATTACRAWSEGKLAMEKVRAGDEPACVATGTYGETEAFLDAIAAGHGVSPAPADVRESVLVSLALARFRGEGA